MMNQHPLSKHTNRFDVLLGVYVHKLVHIDLKPDSQPMKYCDFPVLHMYKENIKRIWSYGRN